GAERAGVEHACEGADQAADDERTPAQPRDADAGEARDAPATPYEQQSTPHGHELEDVEEDEPEGDAVVELERDSEEPLHHDPVDEAFGDAADRLRAADPEHDARNERRAAERRDQRVDLEQDDKSSIDEPDRHSDGERRPARHA